MSEPDTNFKIGTIRFIQIDTSWRMSSRLPDGYKIPLLNWLWGVDIWINDFPLLKTFFLLNALTTGLIVWVIK